MPLSKLPLTRDHRRRLRQLDELLLWAESQFANRPLPDDVVDVVLFQQTGGVLRLARAILAQVWGDSTDSLEGRMRGLVEALINVRYILADDSEPRALAFIHDDIRSRRTMAERMALLMLKGKAPSMATLTTVEFWEQARDDLKSELADIERKHGKISLSWPSIEQRAMKGDSDELYAGAFWLFSQDEHLTTRGLNKYMSESNGSVYFDFGQRLKMLDSFVGMTFVYSVSLLGEISKRTGHPAESDLARFDRVAKEVTSELKPSRSE